MILLVVVLALVAAACSSSDDGGAVTSGPAADRSPEALDDALVVAGIVTVAAPEGAGAPDGLQLTEFQVATMARELERGEGYLGAELDRLGGSPGGLPFSFLIAGWVSAARTKTAQAAASLMGEQQWEQAPAIVYPSAVLLLFAADAIASVDGAGGDEEAAAGEAVFVVEPGRSSARVAPTMNDPSAVRPALAQVAAPVTGVCSTLAGWFNDVLDFIFESLKVATDDGGFLGFLGSIWNAAVDLLQAFVGGVVEALIAPIGALVAEVIGVIGTLSMVSSLLVPWSLDVVEDEPRSRFAVGDEADIDNGFTARVDTNLDIDWPASIEDCARVAGFELPDPRTAVGSAIEWEVNGVPRYGEKVTEESTIDEDNEARYDWITGREATDTGAEEVGVVAVTAVVTSAQIERLKAMLETLITAQIPVEPFGSLVGDVFSELAGPVLDELATLIQSRGSATVRVVYHDQEAPPPTSEPGPTPGNDAAPWEGNVCDLLTDEHVAAIFGGRTPTEAEPADTNTVAVDGYGGGSCRWKITVSEYLILDVFPAADVDVLVLAAYDPHERWYPEMMGGIGEEAVVMKWNGDVALGVPPDASGAIIAVQGDVGVRFELTSNFSAEPVPPGMVAAARVILEGS